MTREELKQKALEMYESAGIALTQEEKDNIEIADFGLNDLDNIALTLITFINTDRCCAKEMVLLPGQACPEHRHPDVNGRPGKEETFRCRKGRVYLYVEGEPCEKLSVEPLKSPYTVTHEVILNPGEQYTLYPDTLHWFKAGEEGAVISEFSTHSDDASDIFTDPKIVR